MRPGFLACALMLLTTTPASAGFAQDTTTTLTTTCAQGSARTTGAPAQDPDLAGLWDFYIDAGGEPSFGLLTVSRLDGNYGGTLTPVRTAPLVVRSIVVSGPSVKLTVASLEGDVTYDATLSGSGDRMCGIVNYHGGRLFPMVAQRRPKASPASPG
jgi:hypothetical protein